MLTIVMKLSRLHGRKNCERVKTKGLLWKGKHFSVRYFGGVPKNHTGIVVSEILLGIVTSSKLNPSAVERNRMRRRCREALRLTLTQYNDVPVAQLILLPRSSSLRCDFTELLSEAKLLLSFLSSPCSKLHAPGVS